MRINKFIASASGLSRRAADAAIAEGRVTLNGAKPTVGHEVAAGDDVRLDGRSLQHVNSTQTILLHKPTGYVVSRNGQGSRTIYDLLPPALHRLKPIGRLDKDSSGLLLLTNDGALAQTLTHPSHQKAKEYEVTLDHPLATEDHERIASLGVTLPDGRSQLDLAPMRQGNATIWRVRMQEGRNRQIRRTFAALGYEVRRLHRTHFGDYVLGAIPAGTYQISHTTTTK